MTESAETTPGRKLLLSRGLWVKIVPVGLFAALGTFAVVQSILGEKNAPAETEQVAGGGETTPQALLAAGAEMTAGDASEDSAKSSVPIKVVANAVPEAIDSGALAPTSVPNADKLPTVPPLSSFNPSRTQPPSSGGETAEPVVVAKPSTPPVKPPVLTGLSDSEPAQPRPAAPGGSSGFKLASSGSETPSATPPGSFQARETSKPDSAFGSGKEDSSASNPSGTSRGSGFELATPSRTGSGFNPAMENASRKSSDSLGDEPQRNAPSVTPSSSPDSKPPASAPSTSPAGASPLANSLRDSTADGNPPGTRSGGEPSSPVASPPAFGANSGSPVSGSGTTDGPARSLPSSSAPPQSPGAPSGFPGGSGIGEPASVRNSLPNTGGNSPAGLPPSTLPNSAAVTPQPSSQLNNRPPNSQPSGLPPFGGLPANPNDRGSGAGMPPANSPAAVPTSGAPSAAFPAAGLAAAIPSGGNQSGANQSGLVPPSGAVSAPPVSGNGATVPNFPSNPAGLGNNANLVRDSLPGTGPALAGAGVPGKSELEGVQIPALSIEKIAPREIQIDQPTEFKIVVRNVGKVAANEVKVTDQVPRGAQFVKAVPEANRNAGGALLWELGTLKPGEERAIALTLQPKQTGEIGSVAQVTFATPASMRVLVTKPQLAVEHSGPAKVMIGDRVPLAITIRNLGNGPAKDVIVQETVPPQLKFAEDFNELEYEIGTLSPGQSRKVNLNLSAAQIGRFRNTILVSGQGGLHAEHQIDMEVVAPQLTLSSDGPNRRYVKRNATHQFSVRNTGTAIATNLDLVTKLPRGIRFVSANNQGQYDPGSNSVYWSLDRLNVGQAASVELTTTPAEVGEQNIEFVATADLDQKATFRQPLVVEDLIELFFEIDDVDDVIEVGSETRYRLRLMNQGSVTATNIQLTFSAEQGIRPVSIDNRLAGEVRGQEVIFAPLTEIRPGEEIVTFITATAAAPGEHRVVARLQADQREMNVRKEESTRVYADR